MDQFTRISHDVGIMGGKACIKGTRVTVGLILMLISDGTTIDTILEEYPYISSEDIAEALRYAAWNMDAKESVIVTA